MKKQNKKGFTIIELVIVIAVIAILAAVLIPTFTGLINKANRSADEQAVAQMNTALKAYEALDGKPENLYEVKQALAENGINADKNLVPVSKGYSFVWDSENNVMLLVNSENKAVYPQQYENKDINNLADFDISYPAANVTDTGAKKVTLEDHSEIDLNCSFSFVGETVEEAVKSSYAGWRTDFVISFDKDLVTTAEGQTYLAGQYDNNAAGWVKLDPFALSMGTIPAGKRIQLVKEMFAERYTFTYKDICELVRTFNCGAYDDGTNKGTTMTVELCLFAPDSKNADGIETKYIVVYTYKYTF